jgi:hypothetical protein
LNPEFLDVEDILEMHAGQFLDLNGLPIERPNKLLEDVTRQVAEGTMSKESLASVFRGLIAVDLGPEAMP